MVDRLKVKWKKEIDRWQQAQSLGKALRLHWGR